MCREKSTFFIAVSVVLGSPLRVQGKGCLLRRLQLARRITPACAGKSWWHGDETNGIEDHPCVCREKCSASSHVSRQLGSPLRVQGKD